MNPPTFTSFLIGVGVGLSIVLGWFLLRIGICMIVGRLSDTPWLLHPLTTWLIFKGREWDD